MTDQQGKTESRQRMEEMGWDGIGGKERDVAWRGAGGRAGRAGRGSQLA